MTDIKQLLPTSIYQAATDPLNLRALSNAANPFATLSDVAASAPTLAQVLLNGNSTGGTTIQMAGAGIADGTGLITFPSGTGVLISSDSGLFLSPYLRVDDGTYFSGYASAGIIDDVQIKRFLITDRNQVAIPDPLGLAGITIFNDRIYITDPNAITLNAFDIHFPVQTANSLLYVNGNKDLKSVTIGSGLSFVTGTLSATNTGTVTSVSVVSTNGFAGTVATSTTTPAITITTTITGLLKGNGTSISAAVAGTDYQLPISLTTTGSSGASTFIANVLNVPNYTLSGLGGTTLAAVNAQNLSVFASTTSLQLLGVITDETGSGLLVFNNGPTFIAPLLGTPASGVATNLTGLPLATGVTGILPAANGGTGVNNAGTFTNATNTTVTGGGTIALGGFTLTVPATGTATLGSPGAAGRIFVGTSATTGAGSTQLTYTTATGILQNTFSVNDYAQNNVTNSSAGGIAGAANFLSNGTNTFSMRQLGTGWTTNALLVANLAWLQSGNNMLINAGGTSIKFAIGTAAVGNEIMRLTTTGLGILTLADANSSLQVNGSLSLKYRAIVATDTFTATDHTIEATTGTFTVNYPSAVGIQGRIYVLKNSGLGVITADASGTETIDGQLTQAISAGSAMMVQSTGSNWIII